MRDFSLELHLYTIIFKLTIKIEFQGWIWSLYSFWNQKQQLVPFQRFYSFCGRSRNSQALQGIHSFLHPTGIQTSSNDLIQKKKDQKTAIIAVTFNAF